MGEGAGTSSDFVALQCLRGVCDTVLHFAESDAATLDHAQPIPIHLASPPRGWRRLVGCLGPLGHPWIFARRAALWKAYNARFAEAILQRLSATQRADVRLIYCHSSSLTECGRLLGEALQCPVVAHFYGTFLGTCIGHPARYRRKPEDYLGWITPVDLRICNDDGTRGLDVARDLGLPLERFLFQPHGLDYRELDAGSDYATDALLRDDTCYVVTASRLIPWKRLERLIEALPSASSAPRFHVLILGDGPERARLHALAARLGVTSTVTFLGALPRKDVYAIMRRCHLFVSTNDESNISRGLKEAMYFGLCIVTLDTGDTRQLIRQNETGLLASPEDPAAFAAALTHALSEPVTRARLGAAAKALILAREPDQDAILRQRAAVLSDLLRGAPVNLRAENTEITEVSHAE